MKTIGHSYKVPPPDIETLRSMFLYDPETGEVKWKSRTDRLFASEATRLAWNKIFAGQTAFSATNSIGYRFTKIKGRRYFAHRIIWAVHYGKWPDGEIDHINGDRSDNRLCNLRDVPRAINLRNCKTPKNNTTGAWGVSWSKRNKKWQVRISTDEKRLCVGYYGTIAEAVVARDAAALLHGYNLRGNL